MLASVKDSRMKVCSQQFIKTSLLTSLFALACGASSPQLAAEKTGELGRPLAERQAPDSLLLSECGDGRLTPVSTPLARDPYLQDVTERSAVIAFSAASSEPILIDVTTPAGEPVLSVGARMDTAAGPNGPATLVADLAGLSPDTVYCYALRGMSERAGFVTAPPLESAKPVRFIAFGDSGAGTWTQHAVMDQMETVPFDLVLHLGDLAYDSGRPNEIDSEYFRVYAPILRSFSAYAVAGNHDYGTDAAAPLRQAFVLPGNGGELGRERWFSFDRGNVHFVGLDTEQTGPEQTAWLDRDLSANQLPWTVVFGHKPPFSSGEHGPDIPFQQYFVPVLRKHQVDLVLSGHEHDYERFRPINGTVYVVSGGGGRETRKVGAAQTTAFSEAVLHFLYVEVSGNTLTLHAIDGVGREFDQAVVTHSL